MSENLLTIAGIIAITGNISGWIAYLIFQLNGKITGQPVAWLMASVMAASSGWIFFSAGGTPVGAFFYLSGGSCCLTACLLSLRFNTQFKFRRKDLICLVVGMAALALSFVSAETSVLFISIYYGINYYLMISAINNATSTEHMLPWSIWSVSAILHTISQFNTGTAAILPMVNTICWLSLLFAIYRAQQRGVAKKIIYNAS